MTGREQDPAGAAAAGSRGAGADPVATDPGAADPGAADAAATDLAAAERTAAAFAAAFGGPPAGVWAAPGRVNVIGEHTDYNGGFVLPIALPQRVLAAVRPRTDGQVRVVSAQKHDAVVAAPLAGLAPGRVPGWAGYVHGMVWSLRDPLEAYQGAALGGLDVLVDGDVPLGAGLSSSAALECAVAVAAVDLFGIDVDRPLLARIAQRAENEFVGAPTGVMDQAAALLCTAGHALFLDTRSLTGRQVPFDLAGGGLALLVVDTRAPHRHADGEYGARRRDCEQAARLLGVPQLRDVSVAAIGEPGWARLPDRLARRARHVVTENQRVLDTVAVLDAGRLTAAGPLLTASHASLRDDFQVSVPELDLAVDTALAAGGYGARMTGGGFGGCAVALVDADRAADTAAAVTNAFTRAGFGPPRTFTVLPSPGARRLA